MPRARRRDRRVTNDADLDRRLFAAVERLGRAVRAARQQLATRHQLSVLGVGVLEALADRRPRRVGDLAAELDISQPTASDAIATLRGKGLVERRRDPDDGRSTILTLTADGAELATQIESDLAPLRSGDRSNAAARGPALRLLLGEIARLQADGIISVNRSCLTCHHYQSPKPPGPARCLLLDMELADTDLRVDCAEHEPVPAR